MEIIIGVLVIAVFFTALISLLHGERAWWRLSFFFLIFFLPLWALALWVPAIGPVWYGIAWVNLMVFAVLLFFLAFAASKKSHYRNQLMPTRRPAEADQHVTVMRRYSAAFWVFIALMIVAILFGNMRPGFAKTSDQKIQKQEAGAQIAIMSQRPWDFVESLKLRCLKGRENGNR